MKKKNVSSKEIKSALDLDAGLEEVALKLRPLASAPGCGNTHIPSNAYNMNANVCECSCCSEPDTQTCGTWWCEC